MCRIGIKSLAMSLLMAFSFVPAIQSQWVAENSLSQARSQYTATTDGNSIFAISGVTGGNCGSIFGYTNTLEIFDPVAGTWSNGANYPLGDRGHTSAFCSSNGLVYTFGGNFGGDYFSYNPGTNIWTPIANPPVPNPWEAAAATACGTDIHVLGGAGDLDGHWIYNTVTNTWAPGPAVPIGVLQHGAVSLNNKIYVMGGRTSPVNIPAINNVQIFDLGTNTWSVGAPMPNPRSEFGHTVGPDGKIYVIGGSDSYFNVCGPVFADVQVYDPVANSWSISPFSLPVALGEIEAVTIGQKIYALGGHDGSPAVTDAVYSLQFCGEAEMAFFNDPAFVQNGPTCDQEATQLFNDLVALGYNPQPFVGTTGPAWAAALSGKDVVVVPETFGVTFALSLSPAAITEIQNFVSSGGAFLIAGEGDASLELNTIFGWSINNAGSTTTGSSQYNATHGIGTQFHNGFPSVPNNNQTDPLIATLPPGTKIIYEDQPNVATIFIAPYGSGEVTYLGWDWYQCPGFGSKTRWLDVLDKSINRVEADFMTIDCPPDNYGLDASCNPVVPAPLGPAFGRRINPGQVLITGGCGDVSVTFVDRRFDEDCIRTIVRTFTATDEGGNTVSCEQRFTFTVDVTPPALQNIPANLTVMCAEEVPPFPQNVTMTDNCSDNNYNVWVNELHYRNQGPDVGEFVEIAGLAGIDLSGYSLHLYNGATGRFLSSLNLSGVIDDEGSCMGALSFLTPLMDGEGAMRPDAAALMYGTALIDFIAWGSSGSDMVAEDGPAVGLRAINIGVTEPANSPVGQSLQLTGVGNYKGDFSWSGPGPESPGSLNAMQTIDPLPTCPGITVASSIMPGSCANNFTIERSFTATDYCGNQTTESYTIRVEDVTAPELSERPGDVTAECSDLPVVPDITVSDNCIISSEIWINEFHYDNVGGDEGEAIEIAGAGGIDLADYTLYLYNGSNGTVYNSMSLRGTLPNQDMCIGTAVFEYPSNGIQNGSPDGIALVLNSPETVIEFISYEGVFVATDGPASGMASTDVVVSETSSTPVGYSLQRVGSGNSGSDFSWAGPMPNTFASLNTRQSIMPGVNCAILTYMETETPGSCVGEYTLERTWTTEDGCGNTESHTQTIDVSDNTPPQFCITPRNITVECDAVPDPDPVSAIDNCDMRGLAMPVWVNEFHYDNAGGDIMEFIEIAGLAGMSLDNYQLYLYNGSFSVRAPYNTIELSGVIDNEFCGYGALSFLTPGLQNGSPDGFALVRNYTEVIQFLSYEGSFVAQSGPAAGMASTDVGVAETFSTPVGQSLQLKGDGSSYPDFTWTAPSTDSPGSLNAGQNIEGWITPDFTEIETPGSCIGEYVLTRTWEVEDDCGNMNSHTQTVNVLDRTPPTAICQDITVELDENGEVTITPEQVDNGSSDNCSPVTLSLNNDHFTCIDVGDNTVILTVTDDCGNASRCTATVTVEDNLPPVFTKCPMNTTFSLDPGLCEIVFNFDIEAIDNCAQEDKFLDQTGGQPLTLFNLTCGFGTTNVSYLRVYQGAGGACVIDSVISGVSQATGSGNMSVNVYEYNGAGLNFANFNFVGGDNWFVTAGTANTLHTFEPNAVVAPNTDYVIETVARSSVFGGVFVGLNPNGETEPTYVACGGTVLGDLDNLGFTNGVIQYVHGRVIVPGGTVPVIPDPGNQYVMGDALPIGGPYKFKFEACDVNGNCSICEFEVLVEEYYDPTRVMSCNDLVQVSLNENCEVEVGADMILEGGPYGCYDTYLVEVYEGYEPFQTLIPTSPTITKNEIGKHLTVKVYDPMTGNTCWSRIIVEDKLPPQLECVDTIVTCAQDLDPSVLGWPVPAGATIVNVGSARCPIYIFEDFDNCGRVELTYKDWVSQGSCAAGYDRIVTRTWTAVDESGNESECTQTITVTLSTFRDVGAPCNFDDLDAPALMCDNRRNPDLDLSGHINVPGEGCVDDYLDTKGGDTLDDLPLDSLGWNYIESGRYAGHPSPYSIYYDAHPQFFTRCACWGPEELVMWFGTGFPQGAESCFNIQFAYEDTRIELSDPDCDAGEVGCYKLLRQWTIIDWCTGEIEGHNQIIKIMDKEGPEIIYPDEVEVGMDVWSCEGTWDVPAPWITDNCSNDTRYEVEVLTGNVSYNGSQWRVSNLAPGEHTAYITAYDCCGNATTHEITLDVVDNVPPVCVADAHTILSLSGVGSTNQNGGFSKIFAESFDDGSFDNCGPVWFKAVRMVIGECDEINGDDDPIRAGYQEYPDDYVKFCCDDVGTTVMVQIPGL